MHNNCFPMTNILLQTLKSNFCFLQMYRYGRTPPNRRYEPQQDDFVQDQRPIQNRRYPPQQEDFIQDQWVPTIVSSLNKATTATTTITIKRQSLYTSHTTVRTWLARIYSKQVATLPPPFFKKRTPPLTTLLMIWTSSRNSNRTIASGFAVRGWPSVCCPKQCKNVFQWWRTFR